ncbi:MAG: DnaD domain protein, partial [Aggregatilineales bacterium]
LAVEHNKRSWRYIHAILRRWQQEGKDSHETPGGTATEDGVDYAGGRFADIIES